MQKNFFQRTQDYFFSAREKILKIFKSKIFPIKNHDLVPEQKVFETPKKAKKFKFELYEDYNGDVLKNETDINTEIFIEFIFGFQNPSFLLRQLHSSSGIINQKILNRAKNALIELRNEKKNP